MVWVEDRSSWDNEDDLPDSHRELDNCDICKGIKGGLAGNENIINGKRVCDYCHAEMMTTVKFEWPEDYYPV